MGDGGMDVDSFLGVIPLSSKSFIQVFVSQKQGQDSFLFYFVSSYSLSWAMSLKQLDQEVKRGKSRKGNILVSVSKLLWQHTGMQTTKFSIFLSQMPWAKILSHRDQMQLWFAESNLRSSTYISSVGKFSSIKDIM